MKRELSLMVSSALGPRQSLAMAGHAEQAGFRKIWITEDYFRKGAFAMAGAILGATRELRVGLGVTSPYVRSLPVLAMETCTVAQLFPGRFDLGIGVGSPRALTSLGRYPSRPVPELRDRLSVLRGLFAGSSIIWQDPFDRLDDVSLDYPESNMPVWIAAEGPHMLRFAAHNGDGVIVSALSSPTYLRWATKQMGQDASNTAITAFVYTSMAHDPAQAETWARTFLAHRLSTGRASGTLRKGRSWPKLEPLLGLPVDDIEERLDSEVIRDHVPYGDADMIAEILREHFDAGATELALAPIPAFAEHHQDPLGEMAKLRAAISLPSMTDNHVGN